MALGPSSAQASTLCPSLQSGVPAQSPSQAEAHGQRSGNREREVGRERDGTETAGAGERRRSCWAGCGTGVVRGLVSGACLGSGPASVSISAASHLHVSGTK